MVTSKLSEYRVSHSLIFFGTFLFIIACGKEEVDMFECSGTSPAYTADIKPILNASCAKSGCHDAITARNGVNLSDYAHANTISHEERFLGAIQHKKGYPKMPDDGFKLSESQIRLLTCWVQNGSPQ